MKKIEIIILVCVLILALFLRIYRLDSVPPALFGDEVDVGYQAYSLLKTGKDISGRFLPFYIKSLSEHRTPLYIYSAVPFVGILGLNEWGVRGAATFWGLLSILGMFFLSRKIGNTKLGLITAFLVAISPWHIQYSRASFEATMLICFLIWGAYLFFVGIEKRYLLPFSFLLFGLCPYIYSTAVLFVPLILSLLLVIFYKELFSREKLSKHFGSYLGAILILAICAIPALYSMYTGEARERFGVIGIFKDDVLLDKVNLARKAQEFYTPLGDKIFVDTPTEAFFHNKPLIYGQVFALNYLQSFSFDFLFSSGDPNFRQSIQEIGQLYLFELLTILLGLLTIAFRLERKTKMFLLGWLILAPIPAALTIGGGHHATRLIIMLVPLSILSAMGISYILNNINRPLFKQVGIIVLVVGLLNFVLYLHRYFVHYPVESWRWWHVGYKEVFNETVKLQDKYKLTFYNNTYEPALMRYLYFTKYDPAKFQAEFKGDNAVLDIYPGFKGFYLNDKVAFGYLTEEAKKSGGFDRYLPAGVLYVASYRDETEGDLRTYPHEKFDLVKTIVNPVNEPIFFVLGGK